MSPDIPPGLREAADALRVAVVGLRKLSGGDINAAYWVALGDRRHAFVKTLDAPPPDFYRREAEGLRWLAEANALRVPDVLAYGPRFLALEWIEAGPRAGDFDTALGQGLAAMHRCGAATFGGQPDNYIGTLAQRNDARPNWPAFYLECRLAPQVAMAYDRGLRRPALRDGLAAIDRRLDELFGPAEPPARLHGDLWSGNVHTTHHGLPCLIDPAAYSGHREVDLAMMKLFGGFGDATFAAYHEAYPLAEGADDRVPLYQLYPLLTHLNLFGGSYLAPVERILERWCRR